LFREQLGFSVLDYYFFAMYNGDSFSPKQDFISIAVKIAYPSLLKSLRFSSSESKSVPSW